jgi:hypothetical protein
MCVDCVSVVYYEYTSVLANLKITVFKEKNFGLYFWMYLTSETLELIFVDWKSYLKKVMP